MGTEQQEITVGEAAAIIGVSKRRALQFTEETPPRLPVVRVIGAQGVKIVRRSDAERLSLPRKQGRPKKVPTPKRKKKTP